MADLTRPAQSLEFIKIPIGFTESGSALDPTTDQVAMAFVTEGAGVTGSTTFINGDWETDSSDTANPIYYARTLVGPGGDYVPSADTAIDVYVRISDSPEVPVKKAVTVRFT